MRVAKIVRMFLTSLLSAAPAAAMAPGEAPDVLAFRTGILGLFDADPVGGLGLEYRHDEADGRLTPLVGYFANTRGNSYLYGGARYPIDLGDNWRLTPAIAVGYYDRSGVLDLGHTIEFQSSIELSYRFESGSRLGLEFSHLSNASLADSNPGSESLALTWTVDAGRLWKGRFGGE